MRKMIGINDNGPSNNQDGQRARNGGKRNIYKANTPRKCNEIVQGPCAHVVLHDRINGDFTDLLTVTEFTKR
jgi:hypothetical protein